MHERNGQGAERGVVQAAARGSVSFGAMLVLGGATLVAVLAVTAVRAGDPAPPMGPSGPPGPDVRATVSADPMTEHGQDALAKGFGRKHTPSELIFPDQTIPLRFSHAKHVELVKCTECHSDIGSSLRAKDRNLPKEAVCLDCHDQAAAARGEATDPPSSCETCHPGFQPKWLPGADFTDTSKVEIHPPAIVLPEPHIKFNHKAHLDKGIGCDRCHKSMGDIDLATRDNSLPLMATCIDCHDGQKNGKSPNSGAPDACKTCHLTNPDGRVDTDLPGGKLAPEGWYFMDAHDDNWLQSHRAVASLGEGGCAACHTQKECIDCHNGVQKPLKVHPNNWILSHTIPARRNDPDCSSCHRSQTFCVDCHTATKVVEVDGSRPPSGKTFHPSGWVEFADASGRDVPAQGIRGENHHSFQAQRNIRACASCHTESSCIACHGAAGDNVIARTFYRISPHPSTWTRTGDCVRVRNKNERVCYKCHTPDAQAMRCNAGP